MEPEISEDEVVYQQGLACLTSFADRKLQAWKDANSEVSKTESILGKLEQRLADETETLQIFHSKKSSYFTSSKESDDLDGMIKDSEARISRIRSALTLVENSLLPAKKIEVISARRRFRTSQKSIEILERNYLKKIVGKAKRRQRQIPTRFEHPVVNLPFESTTGGFA